MKKLDKYLEEKVKQEPIYIFVDEPDLVQFKKLCAKMDKTKSEVFRALIKRFLDENR